MHCTDSRLAPGCASPFVSRFIKADAERPKGDVLSRIWRTATTVCIAAVATGATACCSLSTSVLWLDFTTIGHGTDWRVSSKHGAIGGAHLQAVLQNATRAGI